MPATSNRSLLSYSYGANVIIFEGILSFASKELRDLMDLKIFVHEDSDIRLARRYHSYMSTIVCDSECSYPSVTL